jgi:flagellar hook-basal body complex protein FliE
MSDLTIRGGFVPPISGMTEKSGTVEKAGESFGSLLRDKIAEVNQLKLDADDAITKVELGNSGSIHEAMIALEKADISFRTMLQVRNRMLEAYQEIMRMQV